MKFEAGLQNLFRDSWVERACRYLSKIGLSNVKKHEISLNKTVTEGLKEEINNGKFKLIGQKTRNLEGIFNSHYRTLISHEAAMMMTKHTM